MPGAVVRRPLTAHTQSQCGRQRPPVATTSSEVFDVEAITCGEVSSDMASVVRWKLQFGQSPDVVAASVRRLRTIVDLLLSSGVD